MVESIHKSYTPATYYMTGWLLSQQVKKKDYIIINTCLENIHTITYLKGLCKKVIFNKFRINQRTLSVKVYCKGLLKECKYNADYAKSLDNNHIFKRMYYLGMIEGTGVVLYNYSYLFDNNKKEIKQALEDLKVNYVDNSTSGLVFLVVKENNSLDFLGRIYSGADESGISLNSNMYASFTALRKNTYIETDMKYTSSNDFNKKITKEHFTDAGVDITAVSIHSEKSKGVFCLETGLSVSIPHGFWGMLAPRSSITKSGISMTNSFGVIDSSYRGSIKIVINSSSGTALTEESVKQMLPLKCAQLILIPQVIINAKYSDISNDDTNRGDGGFGSTSVL